MKISRSSLKVLTKIRIFFIARLSISEFPIGKNLFSLQCYVLLLTPETTTHTKPHRTIKNAKNNYIQFVVTAFPSRTRSPPLLSVLHRNSTEPKLHFKTQLHRRKQKNKHATNNALSPAQTLTQIEGNLQRTIKYTQNLTNTNN